MGRLQSISLRPARRGATGERVQEYWRAARRAAPPGLRRNLEQRERDLYAGPPLSSGLKAEKRRGSVAVKVASLAAAAKQRRASVRNDLCVQQTCLPPASPTTTSSPAPAVGAHPLRHLFPPPLPPPPAARTCSPPPSRPLTNDGSRSCTRMGKTAIHGLPAPWRLKARQARSLRSSCRVRLRAAYRCAGCLSALGIAVEHQRKVGSPCRRGAPDGWNCNEAGDDGDAQEQDVSRIPEEYRLTLTHPEWEGLTWLVPTSPPSRRPPHPAVLANCLARLRPRALLHQRRPR